MVFFLKKNRIFLSCLALITSFSMPFSCFAQAVSVNSSLEDIKKAILDDPLFLSYLRDMLFVESVEEDKIRIIIRNYLRENPEILFEMQDVLNAKSTEKIESNQQNHAEVIKNSAQMLFHSPDDAVFGNSGEDITIVEFYDYNCGYCKHSFPRMQALIKKDPKIRFVMKDYPILGQDSVQAHLVARAFHKLMPEKYLLFHNRLMTHKGRATEQSAMEIARLLGGNEKELRMVMQDKTLQKPLENNAEVAYRLGINYTPAYIVGSQIVPGAVRDDDLVAIIAEERKEVRR